MKSEIQPYIKVYRRLSQQGFTLMETLVAVMVLAISLSVLFQVFSGGLKSARISDSYTRAIFYAREKMDEILLAEELAEGVIEGNFENGYEWNIRIRYVEPQRDDAPNSIFDIFNLTVTVFWKDGDKQKQYEIETLTMARKIEPEGADGMQKG